MHTEHTERVFSLILHCDFLQLKRVCEDLALAPLTKTTKKERQDIQKTTETNTNMGHAQVWSLRTPSLRSLH